MSSLEQSSLSSALCSNPINETAKRCSAWNTGDSWITLCQVAFAIVVLAVLSCNQKRVKLWPECCNGRCGLVIPVNLLYTTKHRIIHMLIFSTLSNSFYNALAGNIPISALAASDNPYAQSIASIIVTLLYVLLLCLIYYPLFACVDAPIPIVGHILGALYQAFLLFRFSINSYIQYIGCMSGCQAEGTLFAIQVMKSAPILLVELFLLLWFIGNIVSDIIFIRNPTREKHTSADHYKRVRHLLKRQENNEGPNVALKSFLLKIYPYDAGFKFPLRFLAAMIISIVILYQLSLSSLFFGIQFTTTTVKAHGPIIKLGDEINNSSIGISHGLVRGIAQGVSGGLIGIGVLIPVASAIASIFVAVQIFFIFRNVSDHLHRSVKGDLSFLPSKLPEMNAAMLSSLRYPGYQVAYMFFAWIIYAVLFGILLLAVGIVIVLLIFVTQLILPRITTLLIGFVWAQILYWSQFFVVKYYFLEKAYPGSDHLVLNNRRSYHWFSYIFLLQNTFVGIVSTILRVLMAVVFGVFLFMRLDKVLLMKGFESFDLAHKTYIGFLYLDYAHNNPVLNVFCRILLKDNEKRQQLLSDVEMTERKSLLSSLRGTTSRLKQYVSINDEYTSADTGRPRVSQRAYNRWRVAYTLIRNEQLLDYTASNIRSSKKLSLSEKLQRTAGYVKDDDDETLLEL